MVSTADDITYLQSTPALAAALRLMNQQRQFQPITLPKARDLSPMYRVHGGGVDTEAHNVARMVGEVAERMRRLSAAYGEWQDFDTPAYFDLPTDFSDKIVRIVERVSTVHIRFYIDPLLPSFQKASHFWATNLVHAYQQIEQSPEQYRHFVEELQQTMLARWTRLLAVLRAARTQLLEDIGFLTTSGAEDERIQWQGVWRIPPVVALLPALTPDLQEIPTLTLALDFTLPAQKQPGRIRRLRNSRDRRRHRRQAQ